jgi:hypothetical protein
MSLRTAIRRPLLASLILLLLGGAAFAQFSSRIEGIITDSTGGAVPDVAIRVTNEATGATSNTKTSGTGFYSVPALPAGQYRVEASKAGFNTAIQSNVVLESARVQNVPLTLAVGAIATQVTVSEAPPAVETSEARVSELTTAREVLDLPLAGRNVFNVIAQTPGVTGTGLVSDRAGANDVFNAVSAPSVSANGQRGSSNGFYVDDTSVNDNPDEGGAKLAPNPDSIQEVRVSVNNYSAQYGRNSSVLTQVTTKSGTNGFHGSLFEYHTNNKLTARNVFQNSPDPVSGRLLPVFRRNEFGGSFGMPIVKDHTFVFGSYDDLRSSQASSSLQTAETPQFTDFMKARYPNNIATQLLTSYPAAVAANGPARTVADVMQAQGLGACNGTNALGMPCDMPLLQTGVFSSSLPRDGRQWNVRADQIFGGGSNRLYGSFYRMTVTSNDPDVRPAFSTAPPALTDYAAVNFTHTFSPTLINEAAFGFTRNFGESPVNHPSVPGIGITGMSGFGSGWGPAGFVQNDFHWRDLASYNRGSHAFKFGFDIYRDQDNAPFTGPTLRPNFSFGNIFDFALDKPFQETNINFDPRNGGPPFQDYGFRSTTYGFFVQDDFKVRSNLTLNIGLRWDFSGNPTMNVDRLTNLVLGDGSNFQERIAGAKVEPVKQMFSNHRIGYFAPRLGFAWDPSGQGRVSVRGGYGVFFDRWPNKVWSDTTRGNPPYLAAASASIFNPTGAQPLYVLGTSDSPPFGFVLPGVQPGLNPANGPTCCFSSAGGADQGLKYAYAENWFFGVQVSPAHDWVVEGDYMGSVGKHLYTVIDRNRFAGDLIVNQDSLKRLNPYFGTMNYGDNSGSSVYHGATVSLRKLFSRGLAFQTSYTVGKAIDVINAPGTGSGAVYGSVIDAYDVRRQRGLGDNDIRQKLAFNFVVGLPSLANTMTPLRQIFGGWQLASLAILQRGHPYTVFTSAPFQPVWNNASCATTVTPGCQVVGNTGGDYNADGTGFDVPNAPAFAGYKNYDKSEFLRGVFTASDFHAPPLGQEGTLGRNTYYGPGMAQVDLSLIKNFPIPWFFHEAAKLQFRAEAYNVLNRVNLSSFSTDISSGTFGLATGAFTPRSIQFAGRLEF